MALVTYRFCHDFVGDENEARPIASNGSSEQTVTPAIWEINHDEKRSTRQYGRQSMTRSDLLPWRTLFEHLHAALWEEFRPNGCMEEELVYHLASLRFQCIIVTLIRNQLRREAFESSVITESKLSFDLKLAA
jgi:hypothetical protein